MINLGGINFVGGALGIAGDSTEYYSFPAPELWGGCSGATEKNLLISSYTKAIGEFDCTRHGLNTKTLQQYKYFEDNGVEMLDSEFDKSLNYGDETTVLKEKIKDKIGLILEPSATQVLENNVRTSLESDFKQIVKSKINLDNLNLNTDCDVESAIKNSFNNVYDDYSVERNPNTLIYGENVISEEKLETRYFAISLNAAFFFNLILLIISFSSMSK